MSTNEPRTTAPEDRVPWPQLIAYGMGGLIPIALFNIAGQLMGLLGNISLGLSAFWLGTIMIVPRLWDALSDPVMGHLSDNTRSRWGRRRPYILIGGIAVAVSFVAMWWIPRGEWIRELFPGEAAYNWFQLAYILAGLLLFFTATTIFEIPHGALGMEMSGDYHERTRLFSAKGFLGNLFAMGTPWLIYLAGLEFFRGPGGTLTDGMRSVSLFIAAVLVPLSVWWFFALREPGFAVAKQQQKNTLWEDVRSTISNGTFLNLVAIIFTLAMGFNFVSLFGYYISIFYLYGGDATAAGPLLGVTGTVWAVTALVAVFPLNWLSKSFGKNVTLIIAILLMCAAQLAKIVCYRPGILFEFEVPVGLLADTPWTLTFQGPYLILIPTILLSAGMLMFFTLGSSMVGDICDEDELTTGTRNEGSFYSVYWWFIKMGTAFASFVTGALLVYTSFDERQNVIVDALRGSVAVVKTEAEKWDFHDRLKKVIGPLRESTAVVQSEFQKWDADNTTLDENGESLLRRMTRIESDAQRWHSEAVDEATRAATFDEQLGKAIISAEQLQSHLNTRLERYSDVAEHTEQLIAHLSEFIATAHSWREKRAELIAAPSEFVDEAEQILEQTTLLKKQAPKTLYRLRLVEIGLPLALSCVSILLTLRYPLTEARCYEIKQALEARRAKQAI
ncbi:MAG TPA: MFS transporter [Lacipirellulaceae bacterium]